MVPSDPEHDLSVVSPVAASSNPSRSKLFGLEDLAFVALLTALVGLALVPLWIVDIVPLVDEGSHLHLIRLLHEYDTNALVRHHYIRVDAIVPYLSYYQLVDWLSWLRPDGWFLPLTDIEWANKIVLTTCLVSLPLSALTLLRAAGHSRWLVLGVVPWILNADFFMGFLNYLMSMPIFFWLLAAYLRFLRRPGWGRAALVAGLMAALAVTHYLLWSVSLALLPALGLLFGVRNGWKATLWWPIRDGLLGVPSVALLAPWFLKYFVFAQGVTTSDQVVHTEQKLAQIYGGEHLGPIDNVRLFASRMFDSIGAPEAPMSLLARPGELVTVVWVLAFLLWVLGAVRSKAPAAADGRGLQKYAISGTSFLGYVLALVVFAYFAFPKHLIKPIWLWGVNFRLVEVIGVLAVVALPVCPLRPDGVKRWGVRLGLVLMIGATVGMSLATATAFRAARAEIGPAREALGVIPPGKHVLTLRRNMWGKNLRFNIFHNVTEFYAVLRGGYVPYSFADTSSKPIVVNKETALPSPPWNASDQFSFRWHGRFYDYLVLFDLPDDAFAAELPKQLTVVYDRGPWKVLRNPAPDEYPEPSDGVMAQRAAVQASRAARDRLATCALAEAGMPFTPPSPVDEWMGAVWSLPWGFPHPAVVLPLGWPRRCGLVPWDPAPWVRTFRPTPMRGLLPPGMVLPSRLGPQGGQPGRPSLRPMP
jgi:hypothetical protein